MSLRKAVNYPLWHVRFGGDRPFRRAPPWCRWAGFSGWDTGSAAAAACGSAYARWASAADDRRPAERADARRTDKAARRGSTTSPGSRSGTRGSDTSPLSSSRAGAAGGRRSLWSRAKSVPATARVAMRRRTDEAREVRAERAKKARVTAKARAQRAARVAKARLRYAARCLPTAALALPVGVLGLLTTPLGRRLSWKWLMYPGRRLFAAMTTPAAHLAPRLW